MTAGVTADTIEDDGDGNANSQSSSDLLEAKYRQQMRQIHPQKIELPISTLESMIKEQITLNPEFQRRDRWDVKKKSRFIESVIMNVPIPPVFLGEDEYGSYVVLDGRQRLTAIHEFLKNAFALEDLKVWSELNKQRYSDLELSGLNKTLTRRFVPAILLLKESSPEVKYDVFDRLNTGGVKANEMEIRNAVFRGDFTKLLHTCSESPAFRKLWGIPSDPKALAENSTYSKMEDVEYVLRFFALREPNSIEGRFKDYLSFFMKKRNEDYKADPTLRSADEELFSETVSKTISILGENAFARPSSDGQLRKSAPLADAVLFAMSFVDAGKVGKHEAEKIARSLQSIVEKNEEFRGAITSGTNGKSAIITRTSAAKAAISAAVPEVVKG